MTKVIKYGLIAALIYIGGVPMWDDWKTWGIVLCLMLMDMMERVAER